MLAGGTKARESRGRGTKVTGNARGATGARSDQARTVWHRSSSSRRPLTGSKGLHRSTVLRRPAKACKVRDRVRIAGLSFHYGVVTRTSANRGSQDSVLDGTHVLGSNRECRTSRSRVQCHLVTSRVGRGVHRVPQVHSRRRRFVQLGQLSRHCPIHSISSDPEPTFLGLCFVKVLRALPC